MIEGYKQMGRNIIQKKTKSKVLLIVTAAVRKTSHFRGLKQIIVTLLTAQIHHHATSRLLRPIKWTTNWCALLWGCYWKYKDLIEIHFNQLFHIRYITLLTYAKRFTVVGIM